MRLASAVLRTAVVAAFLSPTLGAAGIVRAQSSLPAAEVEVLGEMSAEGNAATFLAVSDDGARVAWAEKLENGRWTVKANGHPQGQGFQEVANPGFSSDGTRFVFEARTEDGWHYVLDGERGLPYETVGDFRFGGGGRRYAYTANVAKKWTVVTDGEATMRYIGKGAVQGIAYDEVGAPVFAASGVHVAYRAKWKGKERVVLDGVPGEGYDEVSDPTFSPDGDHVAYRAKIGKNKEHVVLDGEARTVYEKVGEPVFGGDGSLVHSARRKKMWVLTVDGEEYGPELEGIWDGTLTVENRTILSGLPIAQFDEDRGIVYFGRSDDGWLPIIDGKPLGSGFDAVTWPAFFGESRADVVYAAAEVSTGFGGGMKGRGRVIVNGVEGAEYGGKSTKSLGQAMLQAAGGYYGVAPLAEGVASFNALRYGVSTPRVSPDGTKVAYAARLAEDAFAVVTDGAAGPTFRDIGCGPSFSHDGDLLYVGATEEGLTLVENGQPRARVPWSGARCESLRLLGGHVVYSASNDDTRRWFLDDSELEGYDRILASTFALEADGALCFVARVGYRWLRVTQPLGER